tara:strand:- start:1280 stop:1690 length:411 start_codon:yes stop_codon:yes gene_type:complete
MLTFFALGAFSMGTQGAEFGQHNALDEPVILPVDEAFHLSVVSESGQLVLLWQIQPGYYLYRDKIRVKGSKRLKTPALPPGLEKTDEYFGRVEVYYESLEVNLPRKADEKETFQVEYQGCADAGICYPPQKRTFTK